MKNADGTPYIRGANGMSQTQLSVGFIYDTRDSEIFTRSGQLHEIAIKTAQGLPYGDDVRYGGLSATVDFYHPLVGPLIFAARGVGISSGETSLSTISTQAARSRRPT